MRLRVDRQNHALYFRLDESAVVDSEEIRPGVILDYGAHDNVVGVEILGLEQASPPRVLQSLQFETR